MKMTLNNIIEAIKDLTEEERKILEHELVLMRLGKEFTFISQKLQNRKMSEFKEKMEHGTEL
ncbi:MAG: hypothetical protein ABRQ39_12670 [Candidatus Eremiobacterota bacterium]